MNWRDWTTKRQRTWLIWRTDGKRLDAEAAKKRYQERMGTQPNAAMLAMGANLDLLEQARQAFEHVIEGPYLFNPAELLVGRLEVGHGD